MSKTWSGVIIAVASGFILLVLVFQDLRTPNAVTWQAEAGAARQLERAQGLVLQEIKDGVIWASDGFSIYRSEGDRGFLKVYSAKPPFGLSWLAYSRTMRRLLGFEESIEVFIIGQDELMLVLGGEIQRLDLATGRAETVHRLRYYGHRDGRGMMPFGMTMDDEGRIYYGEYVTRRLNEGETVALFRSDRDGRNFEIVYEFQPLVVRHIHAVQWDPHGEVLWMGTGDGDEQSRVGYSKDRGETFIWVGQESQDFRTVNFVFAEDHVTWLTDTIKIPSRAIRWHRDNWRIETSPTKLPGHGQYLRPIGAGYSLGTTAEEIASLWLVGPELGLAKIMEWPLGDLGMSGFGAVRLGRGDAEIDDWLYMSPLRVQENQPGIFRLSWQAAFAVAGVADPKARQATRRDDP